jgi:hypothetical protein
MLPIPIEPFERALWDAHVRLDQARAEGCGIGSADEDARKLIAEYLRGTALQCDALRSFMNRVDAEVEFMDRELERIGRLKADAESDRRRFRAHIMTEMRAAGMKSARGAKARFSLNRATPKVLVLDPRALPAHLVRKVPERLEPIEGSIRQALEQGPVAGARLDVVGEQLVIR